MAGLTRKERQDLRERKCPKSLRKEFEAIKKGRTLFLGDKLPDFDAYIEFMTLVNVPMNHAPKKFVKMEGNNFKL